jgi:hypothetical protein
MLFNLFDRTANRFAGGATYPRPENPDEDVRVSKKPVVNHLLRPATQLGRAVGLPGHRQ